jgi:hypothetical protein
MRMHLNNILSTLGASEGEKQSAYAYFNDKVVSVSLVRNFLASQRSIPI